MDCRRSKKLTALSALSSQPLEHKFQRMSVVLICTSGSWTAQSSISCMMPVRRQATTNLIRFVQCLPRVTRSIPNLDSNTRRTFKYACEDSLLSRQFSEFRLNTFLRAASRIGTNARAPQILLQPQRRNASAPPHLLDGLPGPRALRHARPHLPHPRRGGPLSVRLGGWPHCPRPAHRLRLLRPLRQRLPGPYRPPRLAPAALPAAAGRHLPALRRLHSRLRLGAVHRSEERRVGKEG